MALHFDPIEEACRNWGAHGWPATDAMAAATAITRVHQILLGRINVALALFGITFARFEVLALLHFSRRGSLPLGKIGERLQVHAASVTNAIDRLEQDGLVRRERHPDDGRGVLAVISGQGRAVAEEAAQALGAIEFGLAGDYWVDTVEVERLLRPARRNAGDF